MEVVLAIVDAFDVAPVACSGIDATTTPGESLGQATTIPSVSKSRVSFHNILLLEARANTISEWGAVREGDAPAEPRSRLRPLRLLRLGRSLALP